MKHYHPVQLMLDRPVTASWYILEFQIERGSYFRVYRAQTIITKQGRERKYFYVRTCRKNPTYNVGQTKAQVYPRGNGE